MFKPFYYRWTDVNQDTMSSVEYAKSVVTEVTKERPRAWFWTGARSGTVWFGDSFLPRTFWVRISVPLSV